MPDAQPGTTTTTTIVEPLPGVHLQVACTEQEPFAVDIVLVGFAPDLDFRYRIHVDYADATHFDDAFWFHTDIQGTATITHAIPNATQPYEIDQLTLFIDDNHDDVPDPYGGPEIASFGGFFSVSEPCTSPAP